MSRVVCLLLFLLVFIREPLRAQNPRVLISAVLQKQTTLNALSYTVERTDTLVTGQTRHMSGTVQVRVDTSDRLFGFWFRSGRNDVASEVVYTGHVAYETDAASKTYTLIQEPNQIRNLLYHPGGQVLVPDLIRLDTTKAIRFTLLEDPRFFYLTMHYADLSAYDVSHRYKTLSIDRKTLLPTSVRQHQETLGKVQDLFYQIKSLTLTGTMPVGAIQKPDFLDTYQPKQSSGTPAKSFAELTGRPAPAFTLPILTQAGTVSSSGFRGRITLLDFWEVWCGPCLESMSTVAQLSGKYADKGLQIYGIVHETKQLDVAIKLLTKKGIRFLTLIGDEAVKKAYRLNAIPRYVVIDQQGNIQFQSEGFSPDIEAVIQQLITP